MLKHVTIAAAILLSITTFSQEPKKDVELAKTKMDAFISNTGVITKFIDSKLPSLKTSYSVCETRIRKISSGSAPTYFYQIVKKGQYSNNTASIEYSDLLEVIKAFKSLRAEVDKDIAGDPDYLENKFITVDGFQVGYYVSKGKATWYLHLEKYGSDNTLYIDKDETIELAFEGAKNKIDELKNKL